MGRKVAATPGQEVGGRRFGAGGRAGRGETVADGTDQPRDGGPADGGSGVIGIGGVHSGSVGTRINGVGSVALGRRFLGDDLGGGGRGAD